LRLKTHYSVVTIAILFNSGLALEPRAYVGRDSGLLMLQTAGTIFTGLLFTIRERSKSLITRKQPAETFAIAASALNTEA